MSLLVLENKATKADLTDFMFLPLRPPSGSSTIPYIFSVREKLNVIWYVPLPEAPFRGKNMNFFSKHNFYLKNCNVEGSHDVALVLINLQFIKLRLSVCLDKNIRSSVRWLKPSRRNICYLQSGFFEQYEVGNVGKVSLKVIPQQTFLLLQKKSYIQWDLNWHL